MFFTTLAGVKTYTLLIKPPLIKTNIYTNNINNVTSPSNIKLFSAYNAHVIYKIVS